MSEIQEALFSRLSEFAGLSDLVETRIFPSAAPQDIRRPFVVYQRISGARVKNLSGPSYAARPHYQIDAYALTAEESFAIAKQVRLALDGWRGVESGVRVKGGSLQDDREGWDPTVDPKLYRVSMDFLIPHEESNS